MTPEMIMTMAVLALVICLFVFEWVRVDVVGIMMMVLLPLIGLVTAKEAFVGLSSNAVCSIIAVIIIGAGLDKTGVLIHSGSNLYTAILPELDHGRWYIQVEANDWRLLGSLSVPDDSKIHIRAIE